MRILIIDDHQLFALSLKELLLEHKDVEEVYISTDGDFSKEPYLSKTDIIICDLMIPQAGGGLTIINHLRNTLKKEIPIIVLSGHTNPQFIKKAMSMKVTSFLSKNASVEELIEAVEAVGAGQQYIEKRLKDQLINNILVEEQVTNYLTSREKDLLQYICSGLSIKEISAKLSLSPHAVQYYYKGLLKKFKLTKMSELISYVISNGLYNIKPPQTS